MATSSSTREESLPNGESKGEGSRSRTTSVLSLDSRSEDIDAIVNKKWHLEELLGPIRSKLAVLSGGRDKKGAPIITIQPTDHSDVTPANVGKILAYLSKIPHSTLQGLGYTLILDSRKSSWGITKTTLKSIQLTFVEHVSQVLVLKPKSFWNRQRVGVGLTLKKSKYNFTTHVLETPADLLQFLHASQITQDLGGSLFYDHDRWVETQRSLEKHILSLQCRLEDFEHIQDQVEQKEDPKNLVESRDAVRRHVDTKQHLDKSELEIACEAVGHTVGKLLPCENPDFLASFTYLEDLCARLQDTRNQLEKTWEEKGSRLDKILQIRLFESEADKLRTWIDQEMGLLAQQHTNIGDSVSTAQQKMKAFGDHRTKLKSKFQELSHVLGVGERLIAAQHFATEQIRTESTELHDKWGRLRGIMEERAELFDLSVSFQNSQKEFFQRVETWLDECQSKEYPADIPKAEEMLSQHEELKEACHTLYASVRMEGHKIVEHLRLPVGDSSLPTGYVMGTRHIKEILESLFDEKNWIDEQWAGRRVVLFQALNLLKFQKEAEKLYSWLVSVGRPFLSTSNTIGRTAQEAAELLTKHDAFEAATADTLGLAERLGVQAEGLADSKDCDPALIRKEAESLKGAVDVFVSQMAGRKKLLNQARDYFHKMSQVKMSLDSLSSPILREKFSGPLSVIEPLLAGFQGQWVRTKEAVANVHMLSQQLVESLQDSAEGAGVAVDYSEAEESVEAKESKMRALEEGVWQECERRELRWNRTILLNRFEPDVEKHILQLESWVQAQENREWEWAQNQLDAMLQLDAFQQPYARIIKSHDDLVTMGRGIAAEIDKSDASMFGRAGTKSTHPAVKMVEGVVTRMEKARRRLEDVAGPRLQQLQECHQLHALKQKLIKLSASVTALSGSLLHMLGVGLTLEEAESLQAKVMEGQVLLEEVAREVSSLEDDEVSERLKRNRCVQGKDLDELVKILKQRCASLEKLVANKIKITSSSLSFHKNMKNLNASMDECQAEFSSKETGSSLVETNALIKSITDKKAFIKQATEVVLSQGKKLQDVLAQSRTLWPASGGRGSYNDLSKVGRSGMDDSNLLTMRKVQSTDEARMTSLRKAQSIDNLTADDRSEVLRSGSEASSVLRSRTSDGLRVRTSYSVCSPNSSPEFGDGDATLPAKPPKQMSLDSSLGSRSPRGLDADRRNSWDILDSREGNRSPRGLDADRRNSWDILDGRGSNRSPEQRRDSPNHSRQSPGSPKVLFTPRRTHRSTLKAATSVPALNVNQNQQIVQNFMVQIDGRLNQLILLWEGRRKGLEEAQKAVEFREAVPQILEWVDTDGAAFLRKYSHYGRSMEEVGRLLSSCTQFEKQEKLEMSEKVRKLLGSYHALKGRSGDSPGIRKHYTTLQTRWDAFEKEVQKLTANMELVKKFHQVLYEASTWCQTSMHILNEMDGKVEEIQKSVEAASLTAEVAVYLTATSDQQEARIDQLKHISSFLKDGQLVNLTNLITLTTSNTEAEFETCKSKMVAIYTSLQQKEGEKDRAKKLRRKRVRVMEELLQTEEAYVEDLRLIVERFRPRFVSDLLPNSLKGKEDVIFNNIHEVEAFHRTFLLPRLQDHKGIVDDIADLFVECADEMISIYVPFCQGKMASEELLTSHRSYLARVQSLFGIETPLSTLMIKPVQRITKYPLLFRDALKLTSQLGQSTKALEGAVAAVQRILVSTNNAIHICFLENSKELIADLGELHYQGSLLVSEPRFALKAGKERHLFCFDQALLFTRKVELQPQQTADFKYEYKFKIPITPKVQVVEFVEGDPTKFQLIAGDHRLQFKASYLDEKQQWVKYLRSCILHLNPQATPIKIDRKVMLEPEAISHDLGPSPVGSPFQNRKEFIGNGVAISPLPSPPVVLAPPEVLAVPEVTYHSVNRLSIGTDFVKYVVKEDHHPSPTKDSLLLSLNQGDIVEILDSSINGKWFVRAQSGSGGVAHGWFPSDLLERVEKGGEEEEVDGRKPWIQITAGPLSGTSDEEKCNAKDKKAFGSQDVHRHHVIGNLKKVTIALEGGEENGEEEEVELPIGDEESSLDYSSLDRPQQRAPYTRSQTLPWNATPNSPHGASNTSPRPSPHSSPIPHRRFTDADVKTSSPQLNHNFNKKYGKNSQFHRKTVIKRSTRKNPRPGRHNSVGSEHSENGQSQEGEESALSEKSGSEDTLNSIKTPLEARLSSEASSEVASEPGSSEPALSPEKLEKAKIKLKFIMDELVETEKTYVSTLEGCINGYMAEMQSPGLPDALKGKEKLVFGNIKSLCAFHKETFLEALESNNHSPDAVAQCFIDHVHNFELYVTYCENKPKSESFLWTYVHTGGSFFEDAQKQLGYRQAINSYLIQPVQRITKYKLLLGDLRATAKKLGLVTPSLEKAVQITREVPKRANDAMTLSMIYGYEGNVHKHGQIILQDGFTVFERNRRNSARRQLFLLDNRLIITKEKDADGLFVFKDSLKVHSLSVAEKEGDSPNRFAVGTGTVGAWDQYYLFEATSAEKKQEWLQALKDIMKGQYDLLQALSASSSGRPRSKTFDATSVSPISTDNNVAMINLSDDSEQEGGDDDFEAGRPRSFTAFPSSPFGSSPNEFLVPGKGHAVSVAEPTPATPTISPRTLNLFIVAEDCAPPKENEGIMFVHKGQIYDVIDSSSDWWLARLVRDLEPNSQHFCEQGWVPGSFLESYEGHLGMEEEASIHAEYQRRNQKPKMIGFPNLVPGDSTTLPIPKEKKRKKKKSEGKHVRLRIMSSYSFAADDARSPGPGEDRLSLSYSAPPREDVVDGNAKPKAPHILTHLCDETVLAGRTVTFRCQLAAKPHPSPMVEWSHNGSILTIDRAFTNFVDERCILRINEVEPEDDGDYTCTIANSKGVASSVAKLSVIAAPYPPSQLLVKPLTSTSVKLSWTTPFFTGHSSNVTYLVECRDTTSDRWSPLVDHMTSDPSTVVEGLMAGAEYVFRVFACNQIGTSEPSVESERVKLSKRQVVTEFSLDPFESHYDLLEEIGRGQYGTVHDCLHKTTQQTYVAKLLPLEVGRDHAQHELEMLSQLDHPNVVQLTCSYLTPNGFILVFQKVNGDNILEHYVAHDNLTEYSAAGCVEQVLQALQYLHQQDVAHFSIKPENLLTSEVKNQSFPLVRLIHFERARKLHEESNFILERLQEHIEYEAPEILQEQPVTFSADLWSLGAVVFTLLGGYSPFQVDSIDLTKNNILNNQYTFILKAFRSVSQEAKDFISSLLVKSQSKRPTCPEALGHSWLRQALSSSSDPSTDSSTTAKLSTEKLRAYVDNQHWKFSSQL